MSLSIYKGSYMSAHVLLNLLNELGGKKKDARLCRASYRFFPTSLMQDSTYHMTLKSHFISKFSTKTS